MKVGRGYARGNFRADSVDWNPPLEEIRHDGGAAEARRRMLERMERENAESGASLTEQVVRDYMGGRNAAANQEAAYRALFDRIKTTGKTADNGNTCAAEARRRMIERQESNAKASPPLKTDGRTEESRIAGNDLDRVWANVRFG